MIGIKWYKQVLWYHSGGRSQHYGLDRKMSPCYVIDHDPGHAAILWYLKSGLRECLVAPRKTIASHDLTNSGLQKTGPELQCLYRGIDIEKPLRLRPCGVFGPWSWTAIPALRRCQRHNWGGQKMRWWSRGDCWTEISRDYGDTSNENYILPSGYLT